MKKTLLSLALALLAAPAAAADVATEPPVCYIYAYTRHGVPIQYFSDCDRNPVRAPVTVTRTGPPNACTLETCGNSTPGTYTVTATNAIGTTTLTLIVSETHEVTRLDQVEELYNADLDHYFITGDSTEVYQIIANGSAGPGWKRTGQSFKRGGATAVCRFYGSQNPGPNSHFYTAGPGECAGLIEQAKHIPDNQKRWNFENIAFTSTLPIEPAGAALYCAPGLTPVYRAYNNGFARGVDSNHRITSDPAAIAEVVARGWIDEGVVMCAPQ